VNLTPEQSTAKDKIAAWMRNRSEDWLFYLGGFAGTGKTTLIQNIINDLDKAPICLAPTGKAASVLQKKLTTAVVTTIHSALYKPVMPDLTELEALEAKLMANPGAKELREAIKEVKRKLADKPLRFQDNEAKAIQPEQLVIVDEASMVTEKMVKDLRKTRAIVLFVGDPGQLPPVGDRGYFADAEPDAMLSQIQRQALDNPIIALSMAVRRGDHIPANISNNHIVRRDKSGFPFTELAEVDQVLCGKNHMRRRINRAIRKVKYPEAPPMFPLEGEKLICLKNQYLRGGWVVNGMQCFAASTADNDAQTGDVTMDVLYEGQLLHSLDLYTYPFEAHYKINAEEDPWAARSKLAEFDYGYAITAHKSQGSEWGRVALVDDGLFESDRTFRKRWLYTAITRAKDHITWLT
jgi:exodeoxyribonuclease-5